MLYFKRQKIVSELAKKLALKLRILERCDILSQN